MILAISPWGVAGTLLVGAGIGYACHRFPAVGLALLGAWCLVVLYLVGVLAYCIVPGVWSWS